MEAAKQKTKEYSEETKKAGEGSQRFKSALGDIAGSVGVPLTLGAITLAAVGVGKAVVDMGMRMEQTKIAFTTLIGSAEGAQAHLEDLRDFAATTPFEFNDLTEASRRLQAFGFEARDVVPMLTDIGDAVAAMGGNAAMIDRVTLAIGQMSAKGRVQAGEMLQLTEAGIPAWRYLAEAMGMTTAEVMKMSEKGLIPADEAIQSILAGMRQDFGGMMAEQSKTAAGAVSNLNDALARLATVIGEQANPAIRDFSMAAAGVVNSAAEMLEGQTAVQDAIAKGVITQAEYNAIVREAGHPAKALAEAMALVAERTRESTAAVDPATAAVNSYIAAQQAVVTTTREAATATAEATGATDTAKTTYAEALASLRDFNIGQRQRLELERELKILTGELSQADIEREKALGFLAKQMELGNLTQAEYIRLVGELATGSLTASAAIDAAGRAIRNLPDREVNITYKYRTEGGPPDPASGDIGLPGGSSAPVTYNNPDPDGGNAAPGGAYAVGGPVQPNRVVAVHRDEQIVLPRGGTVLNKAEAKEAMGGGPVFDFRYLTINAGAGANGRQLADEFMMQVAARARALQQSGGAVLGQQ